MAEIRESIDAIHETTGKDFLEVFYCHMSKAEKKMEEAETQVRYYGGTEDNLARYHSASGAFYALYYLAGELKILNGYRTWSELGEAENCPKIEEPDFE